MQKQYGIEDANYNPKIYSNIAESGVTLSLLYVTPLPKELRDAQSHQPTPYCGTGIASAYPASLQYNSYPKRACDRSGNGGAVRHSRRQRHHASVSNARSEVLEVVGVLVYFDKVATGLRRVRSRILTLCLLGPTFIAAMSSAAEPAPPSSRPSIFLSYASEDRVAASLIRDTMAAAGLEVWYDENELGGGDAWDKKIRRQIRECDYFLAIISAQTEARHEGYFRREWRLAVERALDMADDHTFLLPVVIDGTDQTTARVPERFLVVQWLKVPNGQATPAPQGALCPFDIRQSRRHTDAPPAGEARQSGPQRAGSSLTMPGIPD